MKTNLRKELDNFLELEKEKILKNVQEIRRSNRDDQNNIQYDPALTKKYINIMKEGLVNTRFKILELLRERKIPKEELTILLIDPYAIFRDVATTRLEEMEQEEANGR